jgi:hypothetical protein
MALPRQGWRRRVTKKFALKIERLVHTIRVWLNRALSLANRATFRPRTALAPCGCHCKAPAFKSITERGLFPRLQGTEQD